MVVLSCTCIMVKKSNLLSELQDLQGDAQPLVSGKRSNRGKAPARLLDEILTGSVAREYYEGVEDLHESTDEDEHDDDDSEYEPEPEEEEGDEDSKKRKKIDNNIKGEEEEEEDEGEGEIFFCPIGK